MGQKTHPTGFRVGIIEPWVSTWFAKKGQYALNIAQDAVIRKFIKKKLYTAGVSRINIARKANNVNITVVTAKPGIVVGRGGQGIDDLRIAVQKLIKTNTVILALLLSRSDSGHTPTNLQLQNVPQLNLPQQALPGLQLLPLKTPMDENAKGTLPYLFSILSLS